MPRTRVLEVEAQSIMSPSKLPDADFVLNPYTGCEFGCVYCYATFMGRYVGESREAWGKYVYVKLNAVDLLRRDLARLPAAKRTATLLMSSVTDPYQGIEKKYRLSRGLLDVLAEVGYPGRIGILTKSPLVLRDIDVLVQLPHPEVGLTVTTTDDALSRYLELRAPLASARLKTLAKLRLAGISTYCFVGPLLPHFGEQPQLLDALFAAIAATGVEAVYVEHMNMSTYIAERIRARIAGETEVVRDMYERAGLPDHRARLDGLVGELLQKHGLHLRLEEVLRHDEGVAASAARRVD